VKSVLLHLLTGLVFLGCCNSEGRFGAAVAGKEQVEALFDEALEDAEKSWEDPIGECKKSPPIW